jgi:hypothetical protein
MSEKSIELTKLYPYLLVKCKCGHHPLAHYEPNTEFTLHHAGCLVTRCKCKRSEEEAFQCAS